MSAAEEARRISERLSDKEAARLLREWDDDDTTTCWQCEQTTTIASLSGDGLCPDCDNARNREGLPEFNGAFR